jgi:hypothetical protein
MKEQVFLGRCYSKDFEVDLRLQQELDRAGLVHAGAEK